MTHTPAYTCITLTLTHSYRCFYDALHHIFPQSLHYTAIQSAKHCDAIERATGAVLNSAGCRSGLSDWATSSKGPPLAAAAAAAGSEMLLHLDLMSTILDLIINFIVDRSGAFLAYPCPNNPCFRTQKLWKTCCRCCFSICILSCSGQPPIPHLKLGTRRPPAGRAAKVSPAGSKGSGRSLLLVGSELGVGSQAHCWCLNLGYWGCRHCLEGAILRGTQADASLPVNEGSLKEIIRGGPTQ